MSQYLKQLDKIKITYTPNDRDSFKSMAFLPCFFDTDYAVYSLNCRKDFFILQI